MRRARTRSHRAGAHSAGARRSSAPPLPTPGRETPPATRASAPSHVPSIRGVLGLLGALGVEVKGGLTLTRAQRDYLELLESRLGFSLTATSGDRTPEQQADAMLAKYRAKGAGELRTVYRQHGAVIDALLAAPKSREAWASIIREKGSRLSRHLRGGAVDVRTRDLSADGLKALKLAVIATGGRPYMEYDHLHVDLPTGYAARSGGETAVRRSVRWGGAAWLIAGALTLGAIGLKAWRGRRDERRAA